LHFRDKKVIIFDLDGTLIDSVPDLAVSVNFTLQSLNRSTYSEDTIRYWVGNGARVLVKRALLGDVDTTPAVDEELYTKALAIFLEHYAHNLANLTKLYPDVLETLNTLQTKGYRLAIVTNKPFDFVQPILETLAIDSLFSYHLGGDSLSEKKPSPIPLLDVCKHFNIEPIQAVMIGDSKNDILAANATKMQSIGVTYGYNYGEPIASYHPTHIINDFGALGEVL